MIDTCPAGCSERAGGRPAAGAIREWDPAAWRLSGVQHPTHAPAHAPTHPRVSLPCTGGGNQRDKAGAVAIRQPYLRVIGFQEDVLNGDTARRPTFS